MNIGIGHALVPVVLFVLWRIWRRYKWPLAHIPRDTFGGDLDGAVVAMRMADEGIRSCTCGEHRHDPMSNLHELSCPAYDPGAR